MIAMSLRALTLAALAALPFTSVSAQDLKIGFVNSERVVRESNLAKAAQARLEAEFGRRERELKDAAAKLQSSGDILALTNLSDYAGVDANPVYTDTSTPAVPPLSRFPLDT